MSDEVARSVFVFFLMSSFSQEVVAAATAVTETPNVIACSKEEDSFMVSKFFQKVKHKLKMGKFIVSSVGFFESRNY